jgi:UMF1 family MFS transporter
MLLGGVDEFDHDEGGGKGTKSEGEMTGYADKRGRWGWMLFDWASQPYHTLIITFIFAPYFASTVVPDPVTGQEMWGWAATVGGVIVAVLAPVLGAMAKPWIALFSLFYILGAWLLWSATPGAEDVVFILGAFVIGLIGVEFATVFTNAMMPDLVPREELGRLSGSGWALGYVGGVIALFIVLALLAEDGETGKTLIGMDPIFGLDAAAREGTRAVGPLAAIWYAVFIIPLFLWTPDAPRRAVMKGTVRRGLAELQQAIRDLWERPGLGWFLASSMFYRDALNGFYVFGGIYAAGVLGWSIVDIGVFGIIAASVGALGAWLGGRADARFGPKPVAYLCILALITASITGISASREAVFFVIQVGPESSLPDILFYCVGAVIGAAGGALQAASRNLLVRLADESRITAAFGLYALTGKVTAFLAPAAIALVTGLSDSQRIGISPVVALFVLGLVLLMFVQDSEGN